MSQNRLHSLGVFAACLMCAEAAVTATPPAVSEIVSSIHEARAGLGSLAVRCQLNDSFGQRTNTLLAMTPTGSRWSAIKTDARGELRESVDAVILGNRAAAYWQARSYGVVSDPTFIIDATVRIPSVEYLRYLRWFPVGNASFWGLEFELANSITHVRDAVESIGGVECWVVDIFSDDGHLTASYWIAPSRSWLPAQQALWGADSEPVQTVVIGEWYEITPGLFLPSTGSVNHHDGGEWEEMAIAVDEGGAKLASLTPTETDLPTEVTSILPKGTTVWDRESGAERVASSTAPSEIRAVASPKREPATEFKTPSFSLVVGVVLAAIGSAGWLWAGRHRRPSSN